MAFPTSPTLRLTIDPRLRQRRIEVRRAQGRRRLRVLTIVLGLVVFGTAAWTTLNSPLLDVDQRLVRGAAQTPPDAILDAAGIDRGDPMVDVDDAAAARRVEQLPWVHHAHVRRSWPGRVVITVEERQASAVTRTNTDLWAGLDRDGRVLEVVHERPQGLIELEGVLGPNGAPPTPGEFAAAGPSLEVVRALSPALAARTTAVVVVHSGELALTLTPRGTVRLGSVDDLVAKVRAVETVLASVDTASLAVLDVRFPSSPVLTRG